MGLDTTHGAFRGSYGGFNKFRTGIAIIAINKGQSPLHYDHDLYPLLNHSDCDGKLTPDECRRIEKGLLAIMDSITDDYVIEKAKEFAEGCKLAYEKNEDILFG